MAIIKNLTLAQIWALPKAGLVIGDYYIPTDNLNDTLKVNDNKVIEDTDEVIVNENPIDQTGADEPNVNISKNFNITLSENGVLLPIANKKDGDSGVFAIRQNATGGYTMDFLQANGYFSPTEIILLTAPYDETLIRYQVLKDLSVLLIVINEYNLGA